MKIDNNYSIRISAMSNFKSTTINQKPSLVVDMQNQTGHDSTFRKISSKYDIHNITAEQTARLSQELYDAGEINLLDHSILSFNPDQNLPYGTGYLTKADSNGNRDLISEYKAQINLNKQMGDNQSLVINERILELLNRVDAAKKSPFNVVA